MRWLIYALLALLASIGLGYLASENIGYVLIHVAGYTIEMTFTLFVLAICVKVFFIIVVIALILRALGVWKGTIRWFSGRREDNLRKRQYQALIMLLEGRYSEAEKRMLTDLPRARYPVINFLSAAIACHARQDYSGRDHFFARALNARNRPELAIKLLHARLLIDQESWAEAATLLHETRAIKPNHEPTLQLLYLALRGAQEWQDLNGLIPTFKKRGIITDETAVELEIQAHRALIETAAVSGHDILTRSWNQLPRTARQNEVLIAHYATKLMETGHHLDAEKVVAKQLDNQWSESLLELYSQIHPASTDRMYEKAESWIRNCRPNDPKLHLIAGKLAKQSQVWGRARHHLERSIELSPTVEAYRELALLLEQLEEPAAAELCYRKAVVDCRPPACLT